MRMKITTAGRAKLVNATNTGTNTVLISHIGLTATGFTPNAAMTQLPGEFKRMTTFGGKSVAADTIHVTLQDSGAEKYTLRGFGLYLSDGTLFAVYGQSEAIMEKATISTLLLSADVTLADIDTAQIKFGSTEFLNPPATESVAGVVELADGAETTNGTDAVRAVTPRGLKTALNNRFGGEAPTPFVKTLLSLATAAAIRTSLEVRGAALKDMGHGNGLDADTLDGKHASDFPQVGEVQTSYLIATNSAQKRWIKLGTLLWAGSGASIVMLEITCGGIGGRRFVTDFVSASTRGYDTWMTALTPAHVDAMVYPARLGGSDALNDSARYGLVLTQNSAGVSTGVELWMLQGGYNHGHRVRPVNVLNATYHGVKQFETVEPSGIVYATVEPVASVSDLRRLVEGTENRWGRRQTFALGLTLPSDQTIDLGKGGGSLRGTDTGSVVLAAGAGDTGEAGGYVYLRPNGSANPAGQLALYKNGFAEMAGARLGTGSGDGRVLCEMYSERPWQFKQGGTEGNTALELHDVTGGKEFRLTNVANDRRIILNPTGGWIYAVEFKGKLTGNADTASKLAAPRTINGTAFDGSANIVTTSWGAYRKVTIGNTTKTLNGGADFSWSLTEIGAAGLAHQHAIGDVQGLAQALEAKGDKLGPIQFKTYDEHIPQTAFAAAFHSATEAPSDAPLKAQHNVLHFGSHWGRAQIAIPNDFDRVFFRTGTRTDWLEAWHSGNFKPGTKANRIPGQVIMFAGKVAPAGTLLCNGAAVSRTTYAELFAAIGTLYGAGDGTTTFNLPAMLEGTVVTHTQKPDTVGTATTGEVIRHAHGASSASAGTHSHGITINGGGGHSHGASAAAAGDHTHGAWTDGQGSHAHTVRDPGHSHTWTSPNHGPGSDGWKAADIAPYAAGGTSHNFTGIWLDEAGHHAHNIGMNGSGNHTHSISVAQVGDHSHNASAADSGAHTHTVTVNNTGGDRNLPAGLRMIYCITY